MTATRTLNRTPHSYKENFTRTPKGEVALRTIMETVQRTLPVGYFPFTTSNVPGRGDALILGTIIVQVDGPHHTKQSTRDHDAYMESQVREQGFNVLRFSEDEILYCEPEVRQILTELAVMKRVILERNRKR